MEIAGYKAPFTPQQATSRRYPLQFLCDFTYAVLDNKTSNLLEYHHLMKHPKHKDVWTKSLSKEVVRLAATTKAIFFINKNDILEGRRGDVTMAELYACTTMERKTSFACALTRGATS
jgi:hypothetical protein